MTNERRRNFLIAIPTGAIAAVLVFVGVGLIEALKDNLLWIFALLALLPVLVILSQISASHLRAAMNPEEPEAPPSESRSPEEDAD